MKRIIAYKKYFADFMAKLSRPEQLKIARALDLLTTEDKIPTHYIKFIRDGIYEFRVNYGNNEFRIRVSNLLSCSTVSRKRHRRLRTKRLNKQ